jgi:cell fate regulator YaaT (PSP1 superfamily)
MPIVCGVKFRGTGKVYYFSPGAVQHLEVHDHVIVETARGKEMGQVTQPIHEVPEAQVVGELKPILRRATSVDLLDAQRYCRQEAEALTACREQVLKAGLPMKMVSAEYNFDGTRLTFCFSSEQRIDFRDLVRDLARVFKTRIELRQIGVRDEAKIMGGMGKCGRPLCCATWLTEFYPVSIRMAKQQDLPLSPMEISGCCGRLLCCLGYENDWYQEVKGRFPKVGKTVTSPAGIGKVLKVSALRETVSILLEDGSTVELTAEQLAGTAPLQSDQEIDLPSDDLERAPEVWLKPAETEPAARVEAARGTTFIEIEDERPLEAPRGVVETSGDAMRRQRPRTGTQSAEGSDEPLTHEASTGEGFTKRSQRRRSHRSRSAAPRAGQGQPSESQPQGEVEGTEPPRDSAVPSHRRNARSRRRRNTNKGEPSSEGSPTGAE